MKLDLEKAKAFLADWDHIDEHGKRANRAEVASAHGVERSHAYYFAGRCRRALANAQQQNGPVPQM